jgi:hypothetical protein
LVHELGIDRKVRAGGRLFQRTSRRIKCAPARSFENGQEDKMGAGAHFSENKQEEATPPLQK